MKTTEINDRGLVRLISETHHKSPTLRGLVDTDDEAAILAELEGETSARLGLKGDPSAGEEIAVEKALILAALTGGRIHIAHCIHECKYITKFFLEFFKIDIGDPR